MVADAKVRLDGGAVFTAQHIFEAASLTWALLPHCNSMTPFVTAGIKEMCETVWLLVGPNI